MKNFIHEKENWTDFTWNNKKVMLKLGEARNQQGRLLGKMESLGFDLQNEAVLNTLTLDVIKSSEIEGEFLDREQVRSSIARRLGIDIAGALESERYVDGIVERKQYYEKLEKTQRGNSEITEWILWFLQCLIYAIDTTEETLSKTLHKSDFWKLHATTILNDRQQNIINRLLDGFDGKLTTSKWAKINKCSQDTAL
jgi:Fic family protein